MLNRRALFATTAGATALVTAALAHETTGGRRGYDGIFERLPTVDLEGRFDFMWGFQNWVFSDHAKASAARQDEILKANGIDPASPVALERAIQLFANDPIVAVNAHMGQVSQEFKLKALTHEFNSNADYYFDEMEAAEKKGPGSLELDADLVVPEQGRHELHMQPGGYVGDPFAGYVYKYGLSAFQSGHNFQNEFLKSSAASVPMPADKSVLRVLELGCGLGQFAAELKARFPNAEVWGLDSSAPLLRYAHVRATDLGIDLKLVHRLGENTRFPDNHFDIVTVNGVFHEVPAETSRQIIKEVGRIVRPGGVFYPMDFYTGEAGPGTDAKAQFATWVSHRWTHEDWRVEWASVDLRREMRAAGFDVDSKGPIYGGSHNVVGVKAA